MTVDSSLYFKKIVRQVKLKFSLSFKQTKKKNRRILPSQIFPHRAKLLNVPFTPQLTDGRKHQHPAEQPWQRTTC